MVHKRLSLIFFIVILLLSVQTIPSKAAAAARISQTEENMTSDQAEIEVKEDKMSNQAEIEVKGPVHGSCTKPGGSEVKMVHKASLIFFVILVLSVKTIPFAAAAAAATTSQSKEKMSDIQMERQLNEGPVHGSCTGHGGSGVHCEPPA
ncbi:hypothetical protein L1049_016430 [Liquidambar formosana]|uniref:Uncharacterized protein n=1 Tax=Liquidambar formosana TaxID=63359 RepID=A0AAP0RZC5_LIQFO